MLGHGRTDGRTDVISTQGILFFINKERLKWTQAETSRKYTVRKFLTDTNSFKHVCTRPIQSVTELLANVHTFTPNVNKIHVQHSKRNIRTKRPYAACSWLVSRSTSDRNRGQDNHYWRQWPPCYLVNLKKFWNMSLKTDLLPFTPFPEDSGILGRYVSLVDRCFPTFRNIVMASSSRCFDWTLEDEGTATF